MKIEIVNVAKLKPLENNVRRHSENQITELAKSVTQFGVTRAMVIDEDNNILIGNGLYFALKKLGTETAECYRMTNLTETQKKKLILLDNKVYSLGADDYAEIQKYIEDIVGDGDYEIAGFDEDVLRQMTATIEEIEESVGDYGTITDEKIAAPAAPVDNFTSQTVSAENTFVSSESANNDTQPTPAQDTRRTVLCPNCGEVIYID